MLHDFQGVFGRTSIPNGLHILDDVVGILGVHPSRVLAGGLFNTIDPGGRYENFRGIGWQQFLEVALPIGIKGLQHRRHHASLRNRDHEHQSQQSNSEYLHRIAASSDHFVPYLKTLVISLAFDKKSPVCVYARFGTNVSVNNASDKNACVRQ